MFDQFARTELLLGREAMEALQNARVAVFGVGGVGGYVAEALARSGVGALDLIDSDRVCLSNLNRQIIATHKTIGQYKVDVMRERILDINPQAVVRAHRCFFLPETKDAFDFREYSYVVDAVDTVTAKIQLVLEAQAAGVPVISSMGAGNKLDPTRFEVADIYQTSVCPLAKVMRRELKKRGVKKLKVVYSKEEPIRPLFIPAEEAPEDADHRSDTEMKDMDGSADAAQRDSDGLAGAGQEKADGFRDAQRDGGNTPVDAMRRDAGRRSIPGSCAFVPSVAGLIIAGEVVKDLTLRAPGM